MRVIELRLTNLRSFDSETVINFPSAHTALVGSNNVGKSNVLVGLDWLLGTKAPWQIRAEEDDYHDPAQPIVVQATIGDVQPEEKGRLFALCTNQQQRGALGRNDDPRIPLKLTLPAFWPRDEQDDLDEGAPDRPTLEVTLWGFQVHRGGFDVRKQLATAVFVSPHRRVEAELKASRWTPYGQLMQSILEGSPQFEELQGLLQQTNAQIAEAFAGQKDQLLEDARVVAYVDDIEFRLTKENNPIELLRNLEVFIETDGRTLNLDHAGTGTQSAVIIGMLELVLRARTSQAKLFLIEEPEAFIHPHGIRHLGRLIKRIATERSAQVITASHSPSLLASLSPRDIIRLDNVAGDTVVAQPTEALSEPHFARFVNQDTAEMFFSSRTVLVEGDTERFLLPPISETVIVDGTPLDLDRHRISVISMESKDNVVNFLRILHEFGISAWAILDNDFLQSRSCGALVEYLRGRGANIDDAQPENLRASLLAQQVVVLSQGEIEDYISNADAAAITGKPLAEVQQAIGRHNKRSSAFKELFGSGKPQYARQIADYYVGLGAAPEELARLIRRVAT
jgi:hypothetical protein